MYVGFELGILVLRSDARVRSLGRWKADPAGFFLPRCGASVGIPSNAPQYN